MASTVSFESRALHDLSSLNTYNANHRSHELAEPTHHPAFGGSASYVASPSPLNSADFAPRGTAAENPAPYGSTSDHHSSRSLSKPMQLLDFEANNSGNGFAASSERKAGIVPHRGDGAEHTTWVQVSDAEAGAPKAGSWNLRPRKSLVKKSCPPGVSRVPSQIAYSKSKGAAVRPGPTRPGITPQASKKQMLGFSIPLKKDDIEADLLAITGSKPSKRPKKRAKAVQRQLDDIFPGLWLDSITADSYRTR